MNDSKALDEIAAILRCPEWDSPADYLEAIAQVVSLSGRDLSHEDDCQGCGPYLICIHK